MTSTIQEAVDAARPGGTVVIPPGVYRESVVITTDRVTLRAAPGTVLDGAGLRDQDGVRVTAPSGTRLTSFELDGLTVRNFTRNGVFLRDVDNYRITGTVTRNDLDSRVDPHPNNLHATGNIIIGNAHHPDPQNAAPSADIVWDTTGIGNCWSRIIADSTAPPTLPPC